MTKDLVIKARKDFGDNPIKVTCDNMITFWDNTAKNPKVIWDDAKETVTIFRCWACPTLTAVCLPNFRVQRYGFLLKLANI